MKQIIISNEELTEALEEVGIDEFNGLDVKLVLMGEMNSFLTLVKIEELYMAKLIGGGFPEERAKNFIKIAYSCGAKVAVKVCSECKDEDVCSATKKIFSLGLTETFGCPIYLKAMRDELSNMNSE